MRVYDGETLKDVDPKAKTLQEYRDYAGPDEGMTGLSTRFAYKILSETFPQAIAGFGPVPFIYLFDSQNGQHLVPGAAQSKIAIQMYFRPWFYRQGDRNWKELSAAQTHLIEDAPVICFAGKAIERRKGAAGE